MIDYKNFDLFLKNSISKQVVISSGNTVLSNEDLYNQEMELEESLCSEEELLFGCCEASVLKFKISDIFSPMMGKWLDVGMIVNKDADSPFSIGRYKVNSDKPAADRRYREIVAYDAMYDIINSSVVSWYNAVLPKNDSKITMRQFRTSFVNHFGLEQEEISLANDSMIVEKTIEVGEGVEIDNETEQVSILKESSLSGKDVITAICEINGCFGHIGRDGKFYYIYLTQDMMGLYPSNALFPDHAPDYLPQSETGHLYPQSPKSSGISREDYISADYEDFICERVGKIQIRQKENDIGAQYPEGKVENQNTYIIEDNFLVYGKSAEELSEIAKNIFEKIKDIVYRPFSADCIGNPCLEVGDPVRIPTTYRLIESYILKRTLKGVQALRDNYSASGAERYSEKVNSISNSIIQLKGRTNTLVRNVDETRLEIERVEADANGKMEEFNSSITQTAEKIELEVSERKEGQEELSSRINQTASSIDMSVSNGEKTAGIHISVKNEDGEEIGSADGNIIMTGIVTFRNLTGEDGETKINGGLIETESIDASKINVKTLYVEEELRIKHTFPDGTSSVRTALLMEDVPGQTFPNLIMGSNRYYANIVIKNDLTCEGVNGMTCSSLYVREQSQFDKMITMSGSDIYLEKSGTTRGLKAYDKNGVYNSIIALDGDDLTTLVGCRSNSDKSTKTTLRGNSVVLGSSGAAVTSDERLKNSFKPLDEFDSVYMDIKPCAFKYNNGTSGRYHFGVKAQNVKEAFEIHGYTTQDFGGFVQMADSPENEDYCGVDDPMGIIYTEFTMWNAHMIQKLCKKIEAQQLEIESLKKSVSFLMERIVRDE